MSTDLTPVPAGGEFQVNTTTTGQQIVPSVASFADGFVVTWTTFTDGVYAQRYDASGTPIGNEFLVNTITNGDQTNSAVATLADGGFVITWMSFGQDGSRYGIYAQRYDADGTPAGAEFRVNTQTQDEQIYPSVTGLTGGGFVITWSSQLAPFSISAQRYDADGTPAGTEFTVALGGEDSSIAGLADGDFVVTWSALDGDDVGVFGQRYDASGTLLGTQFQINTYTTSSQYSPTVAALTDGGFVVAWTSSVQDGDRAGIFAQRFDADGTASGTEFQVNTHTVGFQDASSVTALADGGFVVTWTSHEPEIFSMDVFGQRFDASGNAIGDEFQLNETQGPGARQTFGNGNLVAALGDDQLVGLWYGAPQIEAEEIYGRLFQLPEPGNEAAIIGGQMAGSVTEDASLAVDGVLTIIDPDAGEAAFTAGTFTGSLGSLELTQAGAWTYTLANANATVQALGSGQSLQDIIGITSVDGTGQQITITINGSNEPSGNSNGQIIDGSSANDGITTGNGNDAINAGSGNDTVFAGNGQDLIQAGSGNDNVHGGTGADVIYGDAGDDVLFGDEGKDALHGGAGADEIHGGESADTIFGDGGNDALTGDDGNDKFVFAPGFGSDTISDFDFNPAAGGQDLLDISAFGVTSATFASRVGLLDLGSDIQVTIDGNVNQTITLEHVQLVSNITQSDFILS